LNPAAPIENASASTFFSTTPSPVLCIECKWREDGVGHCRCCEKDESRWALAGYSRMILAREKY